jgi:hypothetical protein
VVEAVSRGSRHPKLNAAGSAELHRYFPEWADRPATVGRQLEADRNSYLAGGYAEEVGYREQGGCRAIGRLDGDPENSYLWRAHIGGLHPGYPEYGTPHDRAPGPTSSYRCAELDEGLRPLANSVDPVDPTAQAGPQRQIVVGILPVPVRHREVRSRTGWITELLWAWKEMWILRRGLGRL